MEKSKAQSMKISAEALVETEDVKDIYLVENGIETKVGSTTEKIRFVRINGREAIERVQTLNSGIIGNRKSITVMEKATCKPISFTDYVNGSQLVKAEYSDEEVHIAIKDSEKTIKLNGYYVDTFSVELILRVLPLKPGFSLQMNGFNATLETEVDIHIQVVESELVIRGFDEFVDTWKVKTYFGEILQYYWIDPVNKELLKQSSQIGDGLILEFRRE
ncbi:hypothetical protein LCD52_00215 [Rossellomorea vietnamensis]|uniref:hypothetical protein n=1 Tax=Rossellomorea vietnamensis TaxID=218284 RepID=UPI001CCE2FFA|nr:hypothetical protein [Rossellomorea vietnamensis]MCA0147202.1 hypothetical protein [Rossellomorea vietnamensis]